MSIELVIQEIQRAITQLNHNSTELTASVAVLRSQVNLILWFCGAIALIIISLMVTRLLKLILKNN